MATVRLHEAAKSNNAALVNEAMLAGCHVDAVDGDGNTPLQNAVEKNCADAVRVLLSLGANVHVTTLLGWTPLHTAAFYGNHEIGKMLVDAGADVEATTCNKSTPLHVATIRNVAMVKMLLAEGADVNALGWRNETVLDSALGHKNFQVAEMLTATRARWDGKGLRYLWISIVVRQSK